MKLAFLHGLSSATALVSLLVSLSQGTAVLCRETGGHIAVEIRAGLACSSERLEVATSEGVPEACACRDDCGPCTDEPLGSDRQELQVTRGARLEASAVAVLESPPFLSESRASCAGAVAHFPSHPTQWARLSRTVLLI